MAAALRPNSKRGFDPVTSRMNKVFTARPAAALVGRLASKSETASSSARQGSAGLNVAPAAIVSAIGQRETPFNRVGRGLFCSSAVDRRQTSYPACAGAALGRAKPKPTSAVARITTTRANEEGSGTDKLFAEPNAVKPAVENSSLLDDRVGPPTRPSPANAGRLGLVPRRFESFAASGLPLVSEALIVTSAGVDSSPPITSAF